MEKKTTKNLWKWAFIILLAIIVGILCFVFIRINEKREPFKEQASTENINEGESSFQIQLTKSQSNQIINYYLNDFQKDSSIKYTFTLENLAMLEGTFKFLNHELQFYLYFEPSVLENGDVSLKAKSVSIGTLNLPISELMKYVEKNFTLPTWVEVETEKETILLHLNRFKFQNGMHVEAEQMNLVDDNIRFRVYLPTEVKQ